MPTMPPERWQEISPHLDHLLSLPADERSAWLDCFRQEKPNLADLLQKLLEEHSMLAREGFLDAAPLRPENPSSLAGQTIGAYTLVSPIGQGGMGSVWLAERSDGRFDRRVAVKFLHYAVATQEGAERFKREGRILGQFAHPHIAELIDAGVTAKGEPYLVLEYVHGEQIDQYCDQRRLDVDARIRLFLDVLGAVTQAHASLIVHRDIKPSNVLVRDDGQVKLLDFGIAKLLAEEGNPSVAAQLTVEGGALTPQFAAPEQVTGGPITTATDVYALGALLFLLLTGQHPAGPGPHSPADLVKSITEVDAPLSSQTVALANNIASAEMRATTPEKLRRQLRGDLDTIVRKMLKKSPAERYPSVTAVADDLQRFLNLMPISARPDTLTYKVAKFARRNGVGVALAIFALFAVISGTVATLVQFRIARQQRDFAFRELARADRVNSLSQFLVSDAAGSSTPLTASDLLDRAVHIVERENYANDAGNHIKILVSLGLQFYDREENEKAEQLLEQAYQLSRKMQEASARAQASCALAVAASRSGKHDRADALIQEGLREISDDPQFALDRVFCLLRGSEVSTTEGAAQEAIMQAQSAKSVLENSTLSTGNLRLSAAEDLATAYSLAGRHREAIGEFSLASAQMSDLGYDDTRSAASLYQAWGLALMLAGQLAEAEKTYRRAIDIRLSAYGDDASSPTLLNSYADALLALRRLEDAAKYAEEAYDKAQQFRDAVTLKQSLMERSKIYREEHDFVRSAAMLDQVEPLLRRDLPPGHYAFARLAQERALLAEAEGDSAKALQLVNKAVPMVELAIKSGGQGAFMLPNLLSQRSRLELSAHESDKAEADAARALSLAQAAAGAGTYSTNIGYAHLALGRALQALGKTDEARAAFRAAAENFEKSEGADHPDTRTAKQLTGLAAQ